MSLTNSNKLAILGFWYENLCFIKKSLVGL
jgi:hypothetical protein